MSCQRVLYTDEPTRILFQCNRAAGKHVLRHGEHVVPLCEPCATELREAGVEDEVEDDDRPRHLKIVPATPGTDGD